jgi:hypothetical protein
MYSAMRLKTTAAAMAIITNMTTQMRTAIFIIIMTNLNERKNKIVFIVK